MKKIYNTILNAPCIPASYAFRLLFIALLLIVMSKTGKTQQCINQFVGSGGFTTSGTEEGQSFILPNNCNSNTLSSVEIYRGTTGTAETVTFELHVGESVNNVQYTQTVTVPTGQGALTPILINLGGGTGSLTCTPGDTYTFLFSGFTDGNARLVYRTAGADYTGGRAYLVSQFRDAFDFNFHLYTAAAMPVELTDFKVNTKNNQYNQLYWQTASETNNEGFEIERSPDGKNWENLGFVNGYGTTQTEQSYQFTDERPLNGINYYRLKQMDFDGKFEYSDIQSVTFQSNGNVPVQEFHNN